MLCAYCSSPFALAVLQGRGLEVTILNSEGEDDQILLRRPAGNSTPLRRFMSAGGANSCNAPEPFVHTLILSLMLASHLQAAGPCACHGYATEFAEEVTGERDLERPEAT